MEIWKDIENYEGLYQVSNKGNVKSLNYMHTGDERLLKPIAISNGYLQVYLYKNGKRKFCKIHRLVASAFLENADKLPQVNHKDEDKTNNNIENLEWCTSQYNCNYGTRGMRISKNQLNRHDQSIPIDMLNKQDEVVGQFPSEKETIRWLRANGFPKANISAISRCCKGNPKYTHAYGYKWRYTHKKETTS